MVSIAVSKMGMTELMFVIPEWKSTASITATFYSLSADAASNQARFRQYVYLSTR